ncbi:IS630 family transposase [Streptomyces sp. NPDC050529]|uniref:IS630 family transposase n=1 Tax=Streptomyces sp. NPDC050529 TaxID=3365624 RepID=UPI0037B2F0B9
MAHPVRVRRLTEHEGQKLQRIVRRGSTSTVRFRRAMMLLASAGGNTVPVIANLVQADEDTVRDVIHRFNEIGLACLDPRWAGGRPRLLLTDDDEEFVLQTATTRPTKLGKPLTRWSIRKLADYLRRNVARPIRIGREALLLPARASWHDAPADQGVEGIHRPGLRRQAGPDRVRADRAPDRTFAFDEFGPLGIRPTAGSCWAKKGKPDRLPATFHRTHGVTYFHGCYSVGDDTLWGVNRLRKGTAPSLAALQSIRAARPDGVPIYVILDNLSAHKGSKIYRWARRNKVDLCFTPTNASWRTRSRRTSGRCGSPPWPTRTTPTTPFRHGSCSGTCAGAIRTPLGFGYPAYQDVVQCHLLAFLRSPRDVTDPVVSTASGYAWGFSWPASAR